MLESSGLIMKYALIDIGGGMRDAFGTGVLDYLLDQNIEIDTLIGVSAGTSNLANYISRQKGRVLRFYTEYSQRKEYMGLREFILHGSYLNMEYIYEELSFPGKEDPFDIDAYTKAEKDFTIVATDARTGEAVYFPKSSVKPFYMKTIEASGTIPLLCRPTFVNGIPYFDGGISEPIPWRKAIEKGCEKLIVIITKRKDDFRSPDKDKLAVKLLSKRYPQLSKVLSKRAETYNRELEEILQMEREGTALIIAPDDTCGVTTTKHNEDDIRRLYRKGYEAASEIKVFL